MRFVLPSLDITINSFNALAASRSYLRNFAAVLTALVPREVRANTHRVAQHDGRKYLILLQNRHTAFPILRTRRREILDPPQNSKWYCFSRALDPLSSSITLSPTITMTIDYREMIIQSWRWLSIWINHFSKEIDIALIKDWLLKE